MQYIMYLPVYTYTCTSAHNIDVWCDVLHLQNASTAPADLSLRRRSMYIDKSSLPSKETTKRQEQCAQVPLLLTPAINGMLTAKFNLSLPLYFSGCVIPKALNSRWLCRCCSSTPALILGWLLHPGPATYEHSASDRASFQSLHGSPPFAGCPIRLSHRNTQKHRCILRPLDLSSFPVPLAGHNGSSVPSKSRHFSSRETRRTPLTLLWTPANAECRAMCHPCHNFSFLEPPLTPPKLGSPCPALGSPWPWLPQFFMFQLTKPIKAPRRRVELLWTCTNSHLKIQGPQLACGGSMPAQGSMSSKNVAPSTSRCYQSGFPAKFWLECNVWGKKQCI